MLRTILVLSVWAGLAHGSDDDKDAQTVLEESPMVSARAEGMGGALSGLADGVDAIHYNPAGIGGLHLGKTRPPSVRQFHLLWLGGSFNKNSIALNNEFNKGEGRTNKAIASAVVDAAAGKRQYGRFSMFPNIGFSRFNIGYVNDLQLAAISKGDGSGMVDTHYRTANGLMLGMSATDPNERLYIGATYGFIERKSVQGEFAYADIEDPDKRQEAFAPATKSYSGNPSNVGILWRVTEKKGGRPVIGLTARNAGGTKYVGKSPDYESLVIEQDLAASISFSPTLGKWGVFSFILEGSKLGESETTISKKMRTGMELTIGGGFGSRSVLAFRTGYSPAGLSYGTHLNIGLLGFQYGSYATDIGKKNKTIIERRQTAVFSVNIGEY